jgi:glycosyltransferase involved in cell wall biosynthesis
MPLVSVVAIFLDEERFIEEAVQSVRDQTLTDWELILVDDGSTDRSTMIARDLEAQDERIRYVDHPRHENRGMSASRNLGAAHARGPYIAFLDADDAWDPNKLGEQVSLMESMPDVGMVCGAVVFWHSWNPAATEADRVVLTGGVADRRLDPPDTAIEVYPLGRGGTSGADVLVRRDVFESVGGFEERFRSLSEDQAFLMKIFLRYPVYISSRPWRRYRQHDRSCYALASRAKRLRHRKIFLDWLQEDDERLADSRVRTAVQRARRKVLVRRLMLPAFALYDRFPSQFRQRIEHLRLEVKSG